jgi:hypothetical protein
MPDVPFARYDQIFPYVPAGGLRQNEGVPESLTAHLAEADSERFMPRYCLTQRGDPFGDPHRPCTPRLHEGGNGP